MLNESAFKVFLISAVLKFFIFASQRKRNGTPATATMEDIHVPEAAERAIRLQLASTIPHIRTDYGVCGENKSTRCGTRKSLRM